MESSRVARVMRPAALDTMQDPHLGFHILARKRAAGIPLIVAEVMYVYCR